MRYWDHADFAGDTNYEYNYQSTFELCMERCHADSRCNAVTYDIRPNQARYHACYLKSTGNGNYNMNFPGHRSAMRCSFTPNVEPPKVADGQYPPKSTFL